MRAAVVIVAGVFAASISFALLWGVVKLAANERRVPARCSEGLLPMGARCCAPGQSERYGRCVGPPKSCPVEMSLEPGGCVVSPRRVSFVGGIVQTAIADWEAVRVEPRKDKVRPFRLDRFEVTRHRWTQCVKAKVCDDLPETEPGLPVSGVSVEQAKAFCRYAGGRLPTAAEWLFAAVGTEGRRFPWGDTGLVCRRAVYGVVDGPCATGGRGPDLAGSRADGRTSAGVHDLAGNVAEWTIDEGGAAMARGGSFRSVLASDLKVWAAEKSAPAKHIGFRCAYTEKRGR